MTDDGPCPLCGSGDASLLYTSRNRAGCRRFRHCRECDLVFVPQRYHLDAEAQRRRYLEHNNDPEDADYRAFLSRLLDPLRPRLAPGSVGLDYGAGPGPALAVMLREEGFVVRLYDPFFHPDDDALRRSYDFIACTETAEHFANPAKEMRTLDRLLRPSGWLGMMTGMLDSWSDFPDWYYHRDPTHVCFYSRRTMEWIGQRFRLARRLPPPQRGAVPEGRVAANCGGRGDALLGASVAGVL